MSCGIKRRLFQRSEETFSIEEVRMFYGYRKKLFIETQSSSKITGFFNSTAFAQD